MWAARSMASDNEEDIEEGETSACRSHTEVMAMWKHQELTRRRVESKRHSKAKQSAVPAKQSAKQPAVLAKQSAKQSAVPAVPVSTVLPKRTTATTTGRDENEGGIQVGPEEGAIQVGGGTSAASSATRSIHEGLSSIDCSSTTCSTAYLKAMEERMMDRIDALATRMFVTPRGGADRKPAADPEGLEGQG
jgi:hypothetical protein